MKTIIIRAEFDKQVLDYPEVFTNTYEAERNLPRAREYFALANLPFEMKVVDESDN